MIFRQICVVSMSLLFVAAPSCLSSDPETSPTQHHRLGQNHHHHHQRHQQQHVHSAVRHHNRGVKAVCLRTSYNNQAADVQAATTNEETTAGCSSMDVVQCLNRGEFWKIADLTNRLANDISDGLSPNQNVTGGNIRNSAVNRDQLLTVCTVLEPIVECLKRLTCLDSNSTDQLPTMRWLRALRYADEPCQMLRKQQELQRSRNICPRLTPQLFREECGSVGAGVDLHWIDIEAFKLLLDFDEEAPQIDLGAVQTLPDSSCDGLQAKAECYSAMVYRYCEQRRQNEIIERLLKFVNFQLLVTLSNCPLLNEDATAMRRRVEELSRTEAPPAADPDRKDKEEDNEEGASSTPGDLMSKELASNRSPGISSNRHPHSSLILDLFLSTFCCIILIRW